MAFYAKSETAITPVEKPPDGGELPPLVIWGPGDPRPTLPIAGWNPGSGNWPDTTGAAEPPDGFWGAGGQLPEQSDCRTAVGLGQPAAQAGGAGAVRLADQIRLDRSDRLVRVCGADRPGADAVEKEVTHTRRPP